jgi:hypothetical protein
MRRHSRERAALAQTSSHVDTGHSGSTFNGEDDVHWRVDIQAMHPKPGKRRMRIRGGRPPYLSINRL